MLSVIPYHKKVRDHFKSQTKSWDFFASVKTKEEQLQKLKSELLKNTYKFTPASEPELFRLLELAMDKLDMKGLPVSLYQENHTGELNAGIIYVEKEAHIVFRGPVLRLMDSRELLALLAHEMSHVKLYSLLNGELEIADRMISSIANFPGSEATFFETARLYKLYTEIFCDRGAYAVTGMVHPVVASLIKISTGLEKISADAYLQQAEEIFAGEKDLKATGFSHPENFIRARALKLWAEKGEEANEEIIQMIEGNASLDALDIFARDRVKELTNAVLQLYLKPNWFRTTLALGHVKEFFPKWAPEENALLTPQLTENISTAHQSIRDYLAYVLYDFALVDSSIAEVSQGRAIQFAEELGIGKEYGSLLKKEQKLSEKKLDRYKAQMLDAYHSIKEGEAGQIYE